MSSEAVVKAEGGGLQEIMTLGSVFAKSGYFRDAKDQAQAVVKILYGRELGLSPVVSMMNLHIVEGKPEMSSNMLAALVKQSGRYDYRVVSHDDKECSIEFSQDGKSVGKSSFTMQDANRAGLVRQGSGWTKYPKAMLFARALSSGVRTYCPDVTVAPIYTLGEIKGEDRLSDDTPTNGAAPVEDAEPAKTVTIGGNGKSTVTEDDASGRTAAVAKAKAEADASLPDPADYITTEQQKNFHKTWRGEMPKGMKSTDWDAELKAWLKSRGYVNTLGEGTTMAIKTAEFLSLKDEAIDYARDLTAKAEESK